MTTLTSDMGWSNATKIVVRGHDLNRDIIGHLNLGDFAFLEITGRTPNPQESTLFNALLAVLVEHGMTPTAMVARLTYLGAPESMQAAIAAGLCGMGTKFVGTAEGAARLLQQALPLGSAEPLDIDAAARAIVAEHRVSKQLVPGLGHPVHKPVDPRATALFAVAERTGFKGRYVALMQALSAQAELALNKPGVLPVNATGALAALASELGIPWQLCRGIAVIGRAVGLVGHIAEELRNPIAERLWVRTDAEVSAHLHAAAREAGA